MAAVTATTLEALAERVVQGQPLQDAEAALILESPDLVAIGMISDQCRRQLHGSATTFVRVFEVHAEAPPSALPLNLSAGEFRIVGPPSSVDAACRAVEAVRAVAGQVPVFGFALHTIEALGAADAFPRLKAAGLDGIAEVAIDMGPSAAAIAAARDAGLLVLRATVQDPPPDLLALLVHARELLRSAGGFRAFAPLPRQLSIANPTTGYDDVKAVALARLVIREVPSIQVDWPLYGPKLAQVGLIVGADDVDGILAVDGGALGARRSPVEEIRGNIRAAGLEPFERNGRFERLGGAGA